MPLANAAEELLNPRTIAIHRPPLTSDEGAQAAYSGVPTAADRGPPIHTGIRCSIQAQRSGGTNPPKLPSDTKRSDWFIYIPASVAPALGTIKQGDMVTDDTGNWYTVQADYWASMGWRLHCSKEEA